MSYTATDTLCPRCRDGQQIGTVNGRFYRLCKDCWTDEDAALREDADDQDREFRHELNWNNR